MRIELKLAKAFLLLLGLSFFPLSLFPQEKQDMLLEGYVIVQKAVNPKFLPADLKLPVQYAFSTDTVGISIDVDPEDIFWKNGEILEFDYLRYTKVRLKIDENEYQKLIQNSYYDYDLYLSMDDSDFKVFKYLLYLEKKQIEILK